MVWLLHAKSSSSALPDIGWDPNPETDEAVRIRPMNCSACGGKTGSEPTSPS
jgi:hypothetical protein